MSPGETSFHVAGFGKAKMKGPGAGHLLPTKVFHRSGEASRRCIKLVFFFDIRGAIDVDAEGTGEASGSGVDKDADPNPKPEPLE